MYGTAPCRDCCDGDSSSGSSWIWVLSLMIKDFRSCIEVLDLEDLVGLSMAAAAAAAAALVVALFSFSTGLPADSDEEENKE